MEIVIHSAILHVLDTHTDQPILADLLLEPEEQCLRYLSGHLQRAFSSEEARDCRFRPDSWLLPLLEQVEDDLIGVSRSIANRWFSLMQQWPAIPCADGLFVLAEVDNVPCIAALKLNYKTTWLHQIEHTSGVSNRLVQQPSALPETQEKPTKPFLLHWMAVSAGSLKKSMILTAENPPISVSTFCRQSAAIPPKKSWKW